LIKTNLLYLDQNWILGPKDYHKIFAINEPGFEALALDVFRHQAQDIPVYGQYLQAIGIRREKVSRLEDIPFLPIRFFKSHEIKPADVHPQAIFESSGTTGILNSRNFVTDLSLYDESFTRAFEIFYGPVTDWCILGLLPSYLERQHSSLVYMTERLIRMSHHSNSGFYLDDHSKLMEVLKELEAKGQKTWLIGVSFALLDLAEKYQLKLSHTVMIETGGMKGRRAELVRPELHAILKEAFQLPAIHSEYGMTELLSQAYSKGDGIFNCPPWMKILVRDEEDPFLVMKEGRGPINVIDLANIHSCSFIATDDAGKLNADGSFEVWGRIDGSDLRGCSLMILNN
jgi:phenylacetate-coenzyme A ligase PaaK-like adenylate-forming protein